MSRQTRLFTLSDFHILSVSGNDAERYLHSRTTADIKSMKQGTGAQCLILNPQGKIEGKMYILCRADGFLLIVDPCDIDIFIESLFRFKVADDVNYTQESKTLLSIQGDNAEQHFKKITDSLPDENRYANLQHDDYIIINNSRFTDPGFDIVVSQEKCNDITSSIGFDESSDIYEYEKLRIDNLQPVYDKDLATNIYGPDIGIEDYASFSKGCYTGQEVVEMATARGKPNRKIALLKAETEVQTPKAEKIYTADNNKSVGFVSSSYSDDGKTSCLSFLKFNTDTDQPLYINNAEFKVVKSGNADS